MPIYDAAEYLPQAIDSVLDQTYEDWELIAVDDNSPDLRVMDILDAITDRRVTVIHLETTEKKRWESVRYAAIINQSAAVSWGTYLTFLCGDDFYYPDRLERMVAKLDEGNDVVYGPQRMLNEDGTEFGIRSATEVLSNAYHQVDLNSVMVTRKAFENAGGFPTTPTEKGWREADAHFWNRLTAQGYKFIPVDGSEPTDAKRYRADSVDQRVIRGETPW